MGKHKAIRLLMVATVLFIQITFLTRIVREHYETNAFIVIAALLVIISIVFGYKYLDLHHEDYAYEKISIVIWVPIGALICYLLNVNGGLGSILSMGIVGTIASFSANT